MSLTLKILLAADTFFALLLILYLSIKYGKLFSKKPEIFKPEVKDGVVIEPEVTYEEEKVTVVTECVTAPIEKKEDTEKTEEVVDREKLTIGTFEDLENFIKGEK